MLSLPRNMVVSRPPDALNEACDERSRDGGPVILQRIHLSAKAGWGSRVDSTRVVRVR